MTTVAPLRHELQLGSHLNQRLQAGQASDFHWLLACLSDDARDWPDLSPADPAYQANAGVDDWRRYFALGPAERITSVGSESASRGEMADFINCGYQDSMRLAVCLQHEPLTGKRPDDPLGVFKALLPPYKQDNRSESNTVRSSELDVPELLNLVETARAA